VGQKKEAIQMTTAWEEIERSLALLKVARQEPFHPSFIP